MLIATGHTNKTTRFFVFVCFLLLRILNLYGSAFVYAVRTQNSVLCYFNRRRVSVHVVSLFSIRMSFPFFLLLHSWCVCGLTAWIFSHSTEMIIVRTMLAAAPRPAPNFCHLKSASTTAFRRSSQVEGILMESSIGPNQFWEKEFEARTRM